MQDAAKHRLSTTSVCLCTLTVLALVYTLYLAQTLILLLLITGLISLLLSPGVKLLKRFYVPRPIGAFLLLAALVVEASFLVTQLQEPMTKWAKLLPELSDQVSQQIDIIDEAIDNSTTKTEVETKEETSWFDWFSSDDPEPEKSEKENAEVFEKRLKESLFSLASDLAVSAPLVLFQFFTVLILILFTLIYSPQLFQQYVELLVHENKRNTVKLFALKAQKQLSRYILTVSLINTSLAIIVSTFLYTMDLQDALLLGVLVGLLNFMPFIGPILALALISIGAFVQWGVDLNTLLVLSGVTLIVTLESQFFTPLVLAKHMRINPLIIILWLLLTGWLWGLTGVIIAVPILVCIKLLLDQSKNTKPWVDFLST